MRLSYLILIFIVFFLLLPSVAFAVILTVFLFPALYVFTTPFAVTVAYFLLDVDQISFLFTILPVVFTVAFTVIFLPAFTLFAAFNEMLFTECFMILIF